AVTERLPEGAPQRQGAILHRVVLVHVQVALAGQAQRETAMHAQLFQHVVEEADAGAYLWRAGPVELHLGADAGLARGPDDAGAPWRVQRVGQDRRPVRPVPEAVAAQAQVGGQLQVCRAVAGDGTAFAVEHTGAQPVLHQTGAGLARRRILLRPGRIDQDLVEVDALAGQDVQQQRLRALECLARECRRAQAILVADHHQPVARIDGTPQGGNGAGDHAELAEAVHLEVVRLADQRAVAVHEQHLRAHAATSRRESRSSTRAFSSGLPMLTRRQPERPGCDDTSRTITPPACRSRRAPSASATRSSRKLPWLGQTRSTPGQRASCCCQWSRWARMAAMRRTVTASDGGDSACSAACTQGAGSGYGGAMAAITRTTPGAASRQPTRAPASACA